ncbi:hypothetical protein ACQVRV_00365 (plasmid) [Ralstonia pseudosolanacearum]
MSKWFQNAGHRFVGYMLFCLLWLVVVLFCAWFKSFWNEPLGADGIVLSFVLTGIVYKALPIIDRLISK